MKIEIFEKPPPQEEETLRLALKRSGASVVVVAVDEYGAPLGQGNLIEFRPDGSVVSMAAINRTLGLKLDSYGRLRGYQGKEF